MCAPSAIPHLFIEDSYLPPMNFVGTMDELEAMGCADDGDAESAGDENSEDGCKSLIGEKFDHDSEDLDDFVKMFEELLHENVDEDKDTDLESELGKDIMEVVEE